VVVSLQRRCVGRSGIESKDVDAEVVREEVLPARAADDGTADLIVAGISIVELEASRW